MTPLALFALLLGFAIADPGQEDLKYDAVRLERRLKAVKASEKITIDGRLDEDSWENATIASDFIQSEPKEGEPSAEQTEVRILYDSQNLYIGVFAHDSGIGRSEEHTSELKSP